MSYFFVLFRSTYSSLCPVHNLSQKKCFGLNLFPSIPEDDVDLEALVNDMNSSLESLYSTCSGQQTETTPLLHNGQTSSSHHHHHQQRLGQHQSHMSPEPLSSSSSADSPQTGLRRSQPMHILAVRRLRGTSVSCYHVFLSGVRQKQIKAGGCRKRSSNLGRRLSRPSQIPSLSSVVQPVHLCSAQGPFLLESPPQANM